MPIPDQIVLHLGPHKTATTHLQKGLQSASDRLLKHGVQFLGPQNLRRKGRTIVSLFGLDVPFGPDWTRPRHKQFHRDAKRLILSDENFLGALHDGDGRVHMPIYDEAPARVAELVRRVGPNRVSVYLCVRHPAAFLTSAYSQMVGSGHQVTVDDFTDANPIGEIDWFPLIRGLSEIDGLSGVTLWRFEDYAALQSTIVSQMVGPHADLVKLPKGASNTGLSQRAIDVILQAPAGDDLKELAYWARRRFPSGTGFPKPELFTEAELALGQKNYTDQVARIADLPRVTLLRPGKTA